MTFADRFKVLLPTVVLLAFCMLGLRVYDEEIKQGGYSPAASRQAANVVAIAITSAAQRCSVDVSAGQGQDAGRALEQQGERNALCMDALGQVEQLAYSAGLASEMVAQASEKSYRATAYNRQGALGVVILMLVILLVLSGLYFSYLSVVGLAQDGTTPTVLRLGSLELSSPVMGAVVLVSSMGFFYLYLTSAFEIRDVRNPQVLAEEVALLRKAMHTMDEEPADNEGQEAEDVAEREEAQPAKAGSEK